ncbi:MAG TPA: transglycosylase domain-containing protein [Ktedonobacteraceae bacterium]
MSENLPVSMQEYAAEAEDAARAVEGERRVDAPVTGRAKITIPLSESALLLSPARAAKITRPLLAHDLDIQTVTSALSLSLPGAKITRPLPALALDEEVELEIASGADDSTANLLPALLEAEDEEIADEITLQQTISLVDEEAEEDEIILQPTVSLAEDEEAEADEITLRLAMPLVEDEEITGQPTSPLVGNGAIKAEEQVARPVAYALLPRPVATPPRSLPGDALTPPVEPPQVPVTPLPEDVVRAGHLSPTTTRSAASLQAPAPRSARLAGDQRRRMKRVYRLQYFSRKHLRRARAVDRHARRRLWTTIWTTFSVLFLLFLALAGTISYIAYNFIVVTQGTYAGQVLTLRDLLPPDNLKIYDRQGNLIDQMSDQGIHTEVSYKQIAPDLVNATVAIEDRTFWQNSGVDVMGIIRAAIADLYSGQQEQGGSTITQQLVKKLIVGDANDTQRKLNELVLAPQVNNHYSKQDIMEMYLNTIYYGHQAYGIDAAATVYFGLEDKNGRSAASQLDLAQSAFLAGLPRNASLYDPATSFATASSRMYDVLQAMVAQRSITQVQAQAAYQEEQASDFFRSSPTLQDQAPHFDEYVLSQLEQLYHLTRAQLSRSGLVVYTTLDAGLQKKILKIMQQHIAEIRDAHHVTNAAEVLIDFHTGAIISMLGSIDYYNKAIDGQYNVALAYRQPGSSFKPYVYATAFAQGASPAQAVDDAKTTFDVPDSNPPTYTPSNYDLNYHGHMTLRCALQNSLNIPAVRVLQHVGIANAMSMAQAMGITRYQGTPGLSLVLGGLDVRLLDHTSAMGVFANGGTRQPYYSISKVVQGTTGKVLLQHQETPGTQVIMPQLAYMMTNVLSDNTSRIPEFFDCNVLQLYANSQQDCYNGNRGPVRPAAAKTGTTQDFRDNWTVGYTTDFVMGVWAGNDDNSPMIDVTGVQGAAPIWHDAMLLAEQGHPIQDFQNPGGLEQSTVTYPDGVKSTDWFLPGTEPSSNTQQPDQPDPGQGSPAPATPYCGTFSFAFQPPAGGGIPANGAWW